MLHVAEYGCSFQTTACLKKALTQILRADVLGSLLVQVYLAYNEGKTCHTPDIFVFGSSCGAQELLSFGLSYSGSSLFLFFSHIISRSHIHLIPVYMHIFIGTRAQGQPQDSGPEVVFRVQCHVQGQHTPRNIFCQTAGNSGIVATVGIVGSRDIHWPRKKCFPVHSHYKSTCNESHSFPVF